MEILFGNICKIWLVFFILLLVDMKKINQKWCSSKWIYKRKQKDETIENSTTSWRSRIESFMKLISNNNNFLKHSFHHHTTISFHNQPLCNQYKQTLSSCFLTKLKRFPRKVSGLNCTPNARNTQHRDWSYLPLRRLFSCK